MNKQKLVDFFELKKEIESKIGSIVAIIKKNSNRDYPTKIWYSHYEVDMEDNLLLLYWNDYDRYCPPEDWFGVVPLDWLYCPDDVLESSIESYHNINKAKNDKEQEEKNKEELEKGREARFRLYSELKKEFEDRK